MHSYRFRRFTSESRTRQAQWKGAFQRLRGGELEYPSSRVRREEAEAANMDGRCLRTILAGGRSSTLVPPPRPRPGPPGPPPHQTPRPAPLRPPNMGRGGRSRSSGPGEHSLPSRRDSGMSRPHSSARTKHVSNHTSHSRLQRNTLALLGPTEKYFGTAHTRLQEAGQQKGESKRTFAITAAAFSCGLNLALDLLAPRRQ